MPPAQCPAADCTQDPSACQNSSPGTTNSNPPQGTTDSSTPELTCRGISSPDPSTGVCYCPDHTVANPAGDCIGHQGGQQQEQPSTNSGTSGGPQTGTGNQNRQSDSSSLPITSLSPPSSTLSSGDSFSVL